MTVNCPVCGREMEKQDSDIMSLSGVRWDP